MGTASKENYSNKSIRFCEKWNPEDSIFCFKFVDFISFCSFALSNKPNVPEKFKFNPLASFLALVSSSIKIEFSIVKAKAKAEDSPISNSNINNSIVLSCELSNYINPTRQ